ncbi:hypothetical protein [Biformimicrobium ophioploci]|uniref:Uncharacterized protein n=1 Tax=Biformimicrobium ophioploci TaxID=3036711 RepID=A0ABQ6M0F6_9GAMM|nr:hypothetical protein [Microbulbifer sp. NKW57]GMG87803.1 hypothetical protein MNKW57_21240 [Microbulbifer sp. NKW57]
MQFPFKKSMLAAVLAGLMGSGYALAQTDDVDVETEVEETGVQVDRIAGQFADFVGSEEEAANVVNGLRDGSIRYEAETDGSEAEAETDTTAEVDTVEGEGGEQGMGYGNVFITMALAEQLAGQMADELAAAESESETGTEATVSYNDALNKILFMRQEEGMGWGQIAKDLGLNLGHVMSDLRSNRPEKVSEKLSQGKPEKMARVAKAEKMERPAKPEKMERPEKPEKPERPEKPQRPER